MGLFDKFLKKGAEPPPPRSSNSGGSHVQSPQIFLGAHRKSGSPVLFDEDGHLMTLAPTGAGKGVSSIIPNLLSWTHSVFVIDPKGENIKTTFSRRHQFNPGRVYLLDPFNIVPDLPSDKVKRAQFNPIDFIEDEEDAGAGITRADRLADALIVKEGGDNAHFSSEARALLKALILHVRSFPKYDGRRTLGQVNILASDPLLLLGKAGSVPGEMQGNPAYGGLVARTAARMAQKSDREASSVWSTVQTNLSQFLDDPRLAHSLSATTFSFEWLTTQRCSVYAVLPVQYLQTFDRWLRLLVTSALDQLYQAMDKAARRKEKLPYQALLLLDEFAHLGNLESVKTAYGVARGANVKIWAILQSISQLDDIYGQHGRENLIANSGAIEVFSAFDPTVCEYFSRLLGDRYVTVRDGGQSQQFGGKDDDDEDDPRVTVSESLKQDRRPFILPSTIGGLHEDFKMVFRRSDVNQENLFATWPRVEIVRKCRYYEHPHFQQLADGS